MRVCVRACSPPTACELAPLCIRRIAARQAVNADGMCGRQLLDRGSSGTKQSSKEPPVLVRELHEPGRVRVRVCTCVCTCVCVSVCASVCVRLCLSGVDCDDRFSLAFLASLPFPSLPSFLPSFFPLCF